MESLIDLPNVTRVEVIDSYKRVYTALELRDVKVSVQDDGETLKIFLKGQDQ